MRTVIALLSLSACATGGAFDRATDPTVGNDTGAHAAVRLDMAVRADDAHPMFPAAVDPSLPTADRMSPRIRAYLGDTASADVQLCVAPDGHVANVELARGSGYDHFDAAMLRDVSAWQFAAYPGPANLKTCERFTISYHPHR